jgi:hypothetical protein
MRENVFAKKQSGLLRANESSSSSGQVIDGGWKDGHLFCSRRLPHPGSALTLPLGGEAQFPTPNNCVGRSCQGYAWHLPRFDSCMVSCLGPRSKPSMCSAALLRRPGRANVLSSADKVEDEFRGLECVLYGLPPLKFFRAKLRPFRYIASPPN